MSVRAADQLPDTRVAFDEDARPESERELRGLVRLSAAVVRSTRFEDVLELAAEEALNVLGCSSVSISRWDRSAGLLRTLINVGDLAPGEVRTPKDETYPQAQFPRAHALLERGLPHVTELDDPSGDLGERRLLETLGKRASLAVPIVDSGVTWGELYVTLAADAAVGFGTRDVRFAGAVADQIAVAVIRAESFARVTRLAFEDPLTGLANRRAFDDRLTAAVEHAPVVGEDVVLVLIDLDGLKATNDELGHGAGDDRLVATGRALEAVAALRPRCLAARIGGDEFALILEGADARAGERAAAELGALLRAADPSAPTVSSGVAALSLGPRRTADLVRMADAAQYRAKRTGTGRVSIATSESCGPEVWFGRREGPRGADPWRQLLEDTVVRLDTTLAGATELMRLDAVASACAAVSQTSTWALSRARDGVLETLVATEAEVPGERPARSYTLFNDLYPLADYPASARLLRDGGALVVRASDAEVDPAERALLISLGYAQMVAVGLRGAEHPMLVELFSSSTGAPYARIAPLLRVLLTHAAHGR